MSHYHTLTMRTEQNGRFTASGSFEVTLRAGSVAARNRWVAAFEALLPKTKFIV